MANTLLTVDMIAKEALDILHESLSFVKNCNNQYDDYFAKADSNGYKPGSSIRIAKPWQPLVGDGAEVVTAQGVSEETISLVIDKHKHVLVEFGAQEQSLKLNDFANRVLKPAMTRLASEIEKDALSVIVGAAQTLIATVPTAVGYDDSLEAKTLLDEFLAPDMDRTYIASPRGMKGILSDTKDLFNSQESISNQYTEGFVKRINGQDFIASNRLSNVTLPADIAGVTVSVNYVEGASTIVLAGLTDAQVIQAGTTFSVAGTNKLGPETKEDLGALWQFTALADVTVAGGGFATVSVNAVKATVDGSESVSALPVATGVVTFLGTAGTTYRQAIAFQKDAFTVSFAPLAKLDGALNSREVLEGVGISVTKDSDIYNLKNICRIDAIYGYLTLQPEYAVRVLEEV